MRWLFTYLICIICLSSMGQSSLGIGIVSSLPDSKIYFVGQLHNNEANTIIETELLLSLNAKYNVQYDILEYAHSTAFLINYYLQTGNESILKFINTNANFRLIKTIKDKNDKITADKKIRFYGIDFENRQGGKYIQKAFEIILKELNLSVSEPLTSLLQNLVSCKSEQIENNLIMLKFYLKDNELISRTLLNKYFLDVLLITNAQFNFSSKRDLAMTLNFFRLYNELSKEGVSPKFLASFGTGHINPKNTNGVVMKLLNDSQSPVKNSLCLIGIQYFNCFFSKENIYKTTDGSLSFLCKNAIFERMLKIQDRKNKLIEFLPKSNLNFPNCNKAIQMFSGIILVNNYGSASFSMWE